jgi:hypothetical protein
MPNLTSDWVVLQFVEELARVAVGDQKVEPDGRDTDWLASAIGRDGNEIDHPVHSDPKPTPRV